MVGLCDRDQAVRVTPGHGVDHLLVVAVQLQLGGPGRALHHLERFGDVPCGVEHVEQAKHAARRRECSMEQTRMHVVRAPVAGDGRFLQCLVLSACAVQVVVGGQLACSAQGGLLEDTPGEVDLFQLGEGELRDEVTSAGLMAHQAFADQGLERLTHRDRADTEEICHLTDRDGGTRRCAAVEDHPPQIAQHTRLRRPRALTAQVRDQRWLRLVCGHGFLCDGWLSATGAG